MAPDDPELAGLGVAAVPVLDEPVEPELVVPELVAAAFWVVVGELAA
jgi:hypothetical protein